MQINTNVDIHKFYKYVQDVKSLSMYAPHTYDPYNRIGAIWGFNMFTANFKGNFVV